MYQGFTVIYTDKLEVFRPLASGMFALGIKQIAGSLNASEIEVDRPPGLPTSFVVMLGLWPILAPFSDTFEGSYYTWFPSLSLLCSRFLELSQRHCRSSLLYPLLLDSSAVRTNSWIELSSVDSPQVLLFQIAVGQSATCMYAVRVLVPSVGVCLASVWAVDWSSFAGWLFCQTSSAHGFSGFYLSSKAIVVTRIFFFLKEAYVPVLLAQRQIEKENGEGSKPYFEAEDNRTLTAKLAQSIQRPLRILFTRPIILRMDS